MPKPVLVRTTSTKKSKSKSKNKKSLSLYSSSSESSESVGEPMNTSSFIKLTINDPCDKCIRFQSKNYIYCAKCGTPVNEKKSELRDEIYQLVKSANDKVKRVEWVACEDS